MVRAMARALTRPTKKTRPRTYLTAPSRAAAHPPKFRPPPIRRQKMLPLFATPHACGNKNDNSNGEGDGASGDDAGNEIRG